MPIFQHTEKLEMVYFFILKYILFEVATIKNMCFLDEQKILSLVGDLRSNYMSQLSIISRNHDLEIIKSNLIPGLMLKMI